MSVRAEDLPDRADDVPRDQQRQRHQHQADRDAPAASRHVQGDGDAERHLDRENDAGKRSVAAAAQRGSAPSAGSRSNHSDAVPEELVVAERVLDRVVDHRHQRDDRENATSTSTGSTMNQALLFQVLSIVSPAISMRQESA